jgi:hypothetical protein
MEKNQLENLYIVSLTGLPESFEEKFYLETKQTFRAREYYKTFRCKIQAGVLSMINDS